MAVLTPTMTDAGCVWPLAITKLTDVIKDIRVKMTDPFGVILSDEDIKNAIKEAIAESSPNYMELRRYTYTWPNVDGTIELPTSVEMPFQTGAVVAVTWATPHGSIRIENFHTYRGRLNLPGLIPNPHGTLNVDLIEPPRYGALLTVNRRFIVLMACSYLARTWQQRTKEDRSMEKQEWQLQAIAESQRSGGAPGVSVDGRYA